MKYDISIAKIPKLKRAKINKEILNFIFKHSLDGSEKLSAIEIASNYTGNGGLHGLNYNDYDNYDKFKKAKKEVEQGQFFTPYAISKYIFDILKPSKNALIADLCAGHGSFINACPNEQNFYGCEIDENACKVARFLYPKAHVCHKDIRFYDTEIAFDYIVGNPPFHLSWSVAEDNETAIYASEYYYCLKSAALLKPSGILAVIVPDSFCKDLFFDSNKIKVLEKQYNYVAQIPLNANLFQYLGIKNFPTKLLILQKKSKYLKAVPFLDQCIDETDSQEIYESYIRSLDRQRKQLRANLILETTNKEDKFHQTIKKLLYDIKRNPKISQQYSDCKDYFTHYKMQKKPESLTDHEWEKKKIKKEDVIKKLKNVIKNQHPKISQKNRYIKDRYGLRYNDKHVLFYELVQSQKGMFFKSNYRKLLNHKIKEFTKQSQEYRNMRENSAIKKWLQDFSMIGKEGRIKLNKIQCHDINLCLQKRYSFLQWEQGTGKTVAGIAQGLYRLEHNFVRNIYVVSTAISIIGTWNDVLKENKMNFITIKSLADIKRIQKGQFVTITLEMLTKYKKHLKKLMKQQSQKVMLVYDESDSSTNIYSKRTNAMLAVFRRVRYKLEMTGTSTRNNIGEFYSEMELLYNNSVNMLSECEYVYSYEKKGGLQAHYNESYFKPIPAYRKGYKVFMHSHVPEKITVFGIGQLNQDIYNAEQLNSILNKTVITRTFEEVVGKKIYEVIQRSCQMNSAEQELYQIAVKEFYKMDYLFRKTGNTRKDAMLKVLNQLILMLQINAAPQNFKEYASKSLPGKFKEVLSIIGEYNERIAIGVRHIDVAQRYYNEIKKKFPERPVYLITGKGSTIQQRKRIINGSFRRSKNGILISTQQALSASMNIDFVNKCIIPELHWNNASMSQYYFRFIRFTSQNFKTVFFVTYKNSIENNLLKMILVKDKLNLFMKGQELTDTELYERFGIDTNMLLNLFYKEKTKDGYEIRWGEQRIL